jgi:aminoglycoside/choline kinase family phosphotransferase
MDLDGVSIDEALRRLYGAVPPATTLRKLRGDASTRSYYRIAVPGAAAGQPSSLVAMRLPEDALGSDELSGAARPRELPFVSVQRLLAERGVPVPRIHVDHSAGRVLLLDDLGDETFAERLAHTPRTGWPALYAQAVDLLVQMHLACAQPDASLPYTRRFDRALLRWELDHFREWGLEAVRGPLASDARAQLDAELDAWTDELLVIPTGFVHRDYQSRNLMWTARGLVVIDFQDALLGPEPYDLVALLCDSYVDLTLDEQRAALERYVGARGYAGARRAAFERGFWLVAVQRKLKDAGRFVFIDRVRANPDFLRHFPQSLRYVGRALEQLGARELDARLRTLLPGFPDAAAVPPARTGSGAAQP